MRKLHSIASALLAAVALSHGSFAASVPQGRTAAAGAVVRRDRARASALAGPIASARGSLEKLEKDKRRRRYRDGWDAIARELDAAVRRAPGDPRVDEARLLVARVREELWGVSRAAVDARVALGADMTLDQLHPGSEAGRAGLISAIHLAQRAHLAKELAQAGARLAKYPRSPEVSQALALVPAGAAHPASASLPAGGEGLSARAATPADRAAVQPVDDREDEGDGAPDEASGKAGANDQGNPALLRALAGKSAVAEMSGASARSSLRAERVGLGAPASPEREPDTDVPAGAAHVLDQIVQAARGQGASDLLGEPSRAPRAPAPAPEPDRLNTNSLHPNDPSGPHDGSVKDPDPTERPYASSAQADDGEPLPEPESDDDDAVPPQRHTLASAPRAYATPADAASEQRARELRKTALAPAAGSMAAQLGLKIHKVVIDAGHGGRDTGAIGPHGLREKDVTLAIAKKVAGKLRDAGLEVALTRDSDAYVSLGERTRIANEANADLFISVHCNAARRKKLSGVETWTLNVSADRYAQRLASFENAEADATVSDLRLILADLATKANASDARELAETVQSSLVKTLRAKLGGKVKDNGVKQALFYVLLGTHMPSILVETAFLSNPEEEKRLKSAKYQDGAAEAIAKGVKQFIDARRELARAP